MYVDNVEDSNSPFDKNVTAPSNSNAARAMRMGNVVTTGWWEGDLDEMSIWNRILSTNERTTVFNSGLGLDLGIAEERVLRTLDVTELVDQTTNFIRFNGVNTQFLRIEGSSDSSLVMAANELAVQIEADPPLTTLHGQFTIPTIAGTPLNGGDPTSSVIDDPNVNTLGFNNVSTPANPELEKGIMWLETIDPDNNGIFAKVKENGAIVTAQVAPLASNIVQGIATIQAPDGTVGKLVMTNDGRLVVEPTTDIAGINPVTTSLTLENTPVDSITNPSVGDGRLFVETVDADNDGIFARIKVDGSFKKVRVV